MIIGLLIEAGKGFSYVIGIDPPAFQLLQEFLRASGYCQIALPGCLDIDGFLLDDPTVGIRMIGAAQPWDFYQEPDCRAIVREHIIQVVAAVPELWLGDLSAALRTFCFHGALDSPDHIAVIPCLPGTVQ